MKLSPATTPWARERLTDGALLDIANTTPSDAEVRFGYSHGWTCRITSGGSVLGEAYKAATPMQAFRFALDDYRRSWLHPEDYDIGDNGAVIPVVDDEDDEEWTNREGMPEFNGSFR